MGQKAIYRVIAQNEKRAIESNAFNEWSCSEIITEISVTICTKQAFAGTCQIIEGGMWFMTRLDFSWAKDRRYWHIENGKVVIHKDAPKEVKEGYEHYLKQLDAAIKRNTL